MCIVIITYAHVGIYGREVMCDIRVWQGGTILHPGCLLPNLVQTTQVLSLVSRFAAVWCGMVWCHVRKLSSLQNRAFVVASHLHLGWSSRACSSRSGIASYGARAMCIDIDDDDELVADS